MSPLSLLGAVGIGLVGSVHCIGMCGGIAGALALTVPAEAGVRARIRLLATAGAGRVTGYALAGALAGGVGFGVAGALGPQGSAVLRVLAALVLLGVALVVGGLWHGPLALERLGGRLWRRLAPLAGGLHGSPGAARILLLGVVWGWVPCGLVYSALGWAATTGHPLDGAVTMAAFGLGTLPATVVTGAAAARLGGALRGVRSRRAAAVALGVFALWTLAGAGPMLRAALRGDVSCHPAAVTAGR